MASKLRDTFIAHTGNKHTPHIFSMWGIVGVIFALVLLAALPRAVSHLAGFAAHLAAVLPAALVEETNAVRVGHNLPVVAYSSTLSRAAQAKAEDMILRGYFSHNSPEGLAPWLWLDQVGYNYQYAGENLAIHFNESVDVVRAWVASPKHYENLVKPEYTEMGIGVATGVMNGEQATVVVQFFGSPVPTADTAPSVTRSLETQTQPTAEPNPVPNETRVAGATTRIHEQSAPNEVRTPQTLAQNIDLAAELESAENEPFIRTPTPPDKVTKAQPPTPVVLAPTYPEPTFLDMIYDNIVGYVVLALLAFLLAVASLYVVHHFVFRTHLANVAFGSIALSIVVLVLIANLMHTGTFAQLPTDSQYASTVQSLR